MARDFEEIAEKYQIHTRQAVSLEAVASVTPLLMMKIPTQAVAAFIQSIIIGMAKDDRALEVTLHNAYDELLRKAYKHLGDTIIGAKPSDIH